VKVIVKANTDIQVVAEAAAETQEMELKVYEDEEWLHRMYWEEEYSYRDMANLAGCSMDIIRGWMKRLGVPVRSSYEERTNTKRYRQKMSQAVHKSWEKLGRRKAQSLEMKKRWASGEMDEIFHSDEFCMRASKSALAAWARGDFENRLNTEEIRRKIGDAIREAHARGAYDGVYQIRPTKPERRIMSILDSGSINYEFQYRPSGFSKVFDFFIPEASLFIEYDGWYWHYSERALANGRAEKDADKTCWARDNGYELLRLDEEDLSDDNMAQFISYVGEKCESSNSSRSGI